MSYAADSLPHGSVPAHGNFPNRRPLVVPDTVHPSSIGPKDEHNDVDNRDLAQGWVTVERNRREIRKLPRGDSWYQGIYNLIVLLAGAPKTFFFFFFFFNCTLFLQ